MRYILLLLTIFTLTSCSYPSWARWPWSSDEETPALVVKMIDSEEITRVVMDYAVTLWHDKRTRLENSIVCYDNQINKIRLEFITQNILEVKDARDYLVDITEGLLERLNENEIIASELHQPFTSDNIDIYINCESYWPLYGDPFYIGWIDLEDGMSYFYAADIKNNGIDWWHTRVEPYFKSLEIVTAEKEAEAKFEVIQEERRKEASRKHKGGYQAL